MIKPMTLLSLPLRYKPWQKRHLRLIVNDMIGMPKNPELDHMSHLQATIEWICRAQDIRNDMGDAGGVSAGWSFEDGWLPSYPETTGYIIETFLAAAEILDRPDLKQRASSMIDWELSLQHDDGTFPGHFGEAGSSPVIFNTGQIMHGMLAGYLQLGRDDCLDAAVKAGYWLVNHQDNDGCWRRFEHNGIPHVYNTRGTWALLKTALVSGDNHLKLGAIKNLDWALSQQCDSGWYASNAFTSDRPPFTHTIAYAIRGFLESGILLEDDRYLQSALKAAQGMAQAQRHDGWLAGTYRDNWQPAASYSCLTGVAQMSLNWIRLDQHVTASELRESARKGIAYLKCRQRIHDPDDAVRGGIPGSFPIWGDYSRFEYPNWAAKFFADALMMDMIHISVPPTLTHKDDNV